jgi:hypothetical protein
MKSKWILTDLESSIYYYSSPLYKKPKGYKVKDLEAYTIIEVGKNKITLLNKTGVATMLQSYITLRWEEKFNRSIFK